MNIFIVGSEVNLSHGCEQELKKSILIVQKRMSLNYAIFLHNHVILSLTVNCVNDVVILCFDYIKQL